MSGFNMPPGVGVHDIPGNERDDESDTPRTDAFICEDRADYDGVIYFARQLERELAEAQSKLQEISITHGKWMADALQAGAELAGAKKDGARLEALLQAAQNAVSNSSGWPTTGGTDVEHRDKHQSQCHSSAIVYVKARSMIALRNQVYAMEAAK